jgi:hypothetical protein
MSRKKELSWYNGGVKEEHKIIQYSDELRTVSNLIKALGKYPEDAYVSLEAVSSYYDSYEGELIISWYRDPTPEELEEKVAKDLKKKRDQEQAEYRQLNELAKRLGKKVV